MLLYHGKIICHINVYQIKFYIFNYIFYLTSLSKAYNTKNKNQNKSGMGLGASTKQGQGFDLTDYEDVTKNYKNLSLY